MKTILVVEDEKDLLMNLNEMLTNEGFNVICASNGLEGRELAIREIPDLILSDIRMPKMDGHALLRELQKNPLTSSIPFIFLSAKVEIQDMREGMIIGADDYLMKPFKMDDLLNAINTRLWKKENYLATIEDFRNTLVRKVPHELRTPLVGILGFSQIIMDEIETLSKEELKQMAEKIRFSGKRLHRRIEKFLIYSELLSFTKETTHAPSGLNTTFELDPDYLAIEIKNHALEFGRERDIEIQLDKGIINVSQKHFDSLLLELLENSAKFSPAGSIISISGHSDGKYYKLKITDRGIGMNNNEQKQILVFNQMSKEESFKEGLGLGLAIVKSIVELYNGYITIERENDSETSIEIGLPAAHEIEEAI